MGARLFGQWWCARLSPYAKLMPEFIRDPRADVAHHTNRPRRGSPKGVNFSQGEQYSVGRLQASSPRMGNLPFRCSLIGFVQGIRRLAWSQTLAAPYWRTGLVALPPDSAPAKIVARSTYPGRPMPLLSRLRAAISHRPVADHLGQHPARKRFASRSWVAWPVGSSVASDGDAKLALSA
jgi:hypothetical protein